MMADAAQQIAAAHQPERSLDDPGKRRERRMGGQAAGRVKRAQ